MASAPAIPWFLQALIAMMSERTGNPHPGHGVFIVDDHAGMRRVLRRLVERTPVFYVNSGRIAYAVLDFGGFLGMGNKLFAIPFGAFRIDEHNHTMILSVDDEVLKNAEGFDKDHWPDTADPEWGVRSSLRTPAGGVRADL